MSNDGLDNLDRIVGPEDGAAHNPAGIPGDVNVEAVPFEFTPPAHADTLAGEVIVGATVDTPTATRTSGAEGLPEGSRPAAIDVVNSLAILSDIEGGEADIVDVSTRVMAIQDPATLESLTDTILPLIGQELEAGDETEYVLITETVRQSIKTIPDDDVRQRIAQKIDGSLRIALRDMLHKDGSFSVQRAVIMAGLAESHGVRLRISLDIVDHCLLAKNYRLAMAVLRSADFDRGTSSEYESTIANRESENRSAPLSRKSIHK